MSLSTLTSRVSAARAAIGDTGSEQKLIRTIPRRGYRFVGAAVTDDGPTSVQLPTSLHQEVQFCRSIDGVRLAWSRVGTGLSDRAAALGVRRGRDPARCR